MLRALKERKRTMHSERKRTWCPTLRNTPAKHCQKQGATISSKVPLQCSGKPLCLFLQRPGFESYPAEVGDIANVSEDFLYYHKLFLCQNMTLQNCLQLTHERVPKYQNCLQLKPESVLKITKMFTIISGRMHYHNKV